jgi:uncharacterized protein (TIGR00369 family)
MGAIFGAKIPFADLCGIEFLGVENGATRLHVALEAKHANNFGIPHGGLVATLLDIAMGSAARLADGGPVMTLDMQISFLASGQRTLTAEGRVVRAGNSVLFCEAEARDSNGDLVAKSSGLFKRRKARTGAAQE